MKKLTRDELVTALRNDTTCEDCICAAECDHDTCLLYAAAADMLENHETERLALVKEIEKLRKQAEELTKAGLIATDKANQAIAERDAAYQQLGGEPPKTCKTCELWGKSGWGQYQVGFCEGDDHPHVPDDFCSRHCPKKEA